MDRISISIWLKKSAPTVNYCMFCRDNLGVKLEGVPSVVLVGIDAAQIQDNYRPLVMPIRIKCYGKSQRYGKCPAEYIIQGFVED